MGRSNKFDYQAAIVSRLAEHRGGLTLDELLQRSGLDVDRSTLFRHLARLIDEGRAERTGKARASRYSLLDGAGPALSGTPDSEIQAAPEPSEQLFPVPMPPVIAGPRPNLREAGSAGAPDTDKDAASPGSARPQLRANTDSNRIEELKYGPLVKKAVRRIVRERNVFNPVNLEIYLSLLVPRKDLDEFAAIVSRELAGLQADNLHRFELSPAEFSGFVPR